MEQAPDITISTMSMPHSREALAMTEAFMHAYENPGQLVVIATDRHQHGMHLLQRLRDACVFMGDQEVKMHREAIEIHRMEEGWEPSKLVIVALSDPGRLAGLRPNRIYLCGPLGEFLYWAQGNGGDLIPVA